MELTNLDVELSNTQLVLIGFALAVVYVLIEYRDGRAFGTKHRPDLYSPRGIPGLGNLIDVARHRDQVLEMMYQSYHDNKSGKTMSLVLPGQRMIALTKPEHLEHIQKTNFNNYGKGRQFHDNVKDILGDGIFAVDGDLWHKQRKATSRVFTGSAFRGVISSSLDSSLTKTIKILESHANSGKPFALDTLFFAFTLQSFAEMAMGIDVGALNLESDKPIPFAEAFDQAQELLDRRFLDPTWKFTEKLDGRARTMRRATKVLDDFCYKVIDDRRQKGLGNVTKEDKKDESLDLLSMFMALRDDQGQPLSDRQLRDACLNLIIAGRDTTAQALSWTFWRLLAQAPEWMDKVRKEADESGELDYDSFRSFTLANSVFMEGLRLSPSVPKNLWTAQGPDQIPNGPRIEKGDFVMWSDWLQNRLPEIWGQDATEYKPERWIDDEGKLKQESQWKFHAFNGGYRLCLGQDLAKYEAVVVISTLIKNFDFKFSSEYNPELMPMEPTPRNRTSLTLPMRESLMVTVSKRK
ncbi:hypothetical protein OIO90_001194 [Microbotryomycetes sp. JL221]|nr:hypothetical protein OIO90_001194 [Microbotryomycetes sp. JL221]